MRLNPASPEEDRPPPGDSWAPRVGLMLLLVGLGCRLLRYLLAYPIWIDEAFLALNFADRDFAGLRHELDYLQVAPLLYLWLGKAIFTWQGFSEQWLRLPSLLAGSGALVLFWACVRRRLAPWPAALATGLLAVTQSPIVLSTMIKPYAIDLFLSVSFLSLAIRYHGDPARLAPLIALALLTPFAVCSSYPIVFVAGAVSLVLLPVAWRAGGSARAWFTAFNVLTVGSFVAHLLFVGRPSVGQDVPEVMPYMKQFWYEGFPTPGGGPWLFLHWVLRRHVGRMFAYPLVWNGAGLVGFAFCVTGACVLWRQRHRALLALCLLPFGLHFVAGVMRRFPYGALQRIEQHLGPMICILFATGLVAVIQAVARSEAARRRSLFAAAGLLGLVGVGTAVECVLRPYQDPAAAWARDIVAHLRRNSRPDDPILVLGPRRFIYAPLRWGLHQIGEQVSYQMHARGGEDRTGQTWVVSMRIEVVAAPASPPPAPEPANTVGLLGSADWRTRDVVRFLAHLPAERGQEYRYWSDIHRVERVGVGVVKGR